MTEILFFGLVAGPAYVLLGGPIQRAVAAYFAVGFAVGVLIGIR